MKYVVMLGDGMADLPLAELQNRTPLAAANKPHMDFLARHGAVGLAKTIPEGMPTGSDTANLSVMGYDPQRYYSGRSPLEAVSMGVELQPDDVAFRCNLVTLSDADRYEDMEMLDYSSDEISTEEAAALIAFLNQEFQRDGLRLYPGVSYRHCLVLSHAETGSECTPPHDILTRKVGEHLPQGRYGALLLDLMRRSRALLPNHPVNRRRVEKGLRPANSCWFWGEGTRPALPPFADRYGVTGGVISAVDLLKGIGLCAGMQVVDVPGATGTIDTNFAGKKDAALALLRGGCDLVYIHIEAPDECGHRHEIENKVRAIELIDSEVLGPILDALRADGAPFSVLLLPDHPTPLSLRTHTRDPIPFVLYRSDRSLLPHAEQYCEACAARTRLYQPKGWELMRALVDGELRMEPEA